MDFDMFELDPSELAFRITVFAGFDDASVKMEILSDRVNGHFRTKFDDRSLQCLVKESACQRGQYVRRSFSSK